jgi:hypothetical protein
MLKREACYRKTTLLNLAKARIRKVQGPVSSEELVKNVCAVDVYEAVTATGFSESSFFRHRQAPSQ